MEIANFFYTNWEKLLGFFLTFFSVLLPIYKYFRDKRLEERDRRFQNYHKLIDELVGHEEKLPMLDRQIAIAYELRNFKEYYPVTCRILKGLKQEWSKQDSPKDINRLLEEIDMTLDYIESK